LKALFLVDNCWGANCKGITCETIRIAAENCKRRRQKLDFNMEEKKYKITNSAFCLLLREDEELQVSIAIESLRRFGGEIGKSPVFIFIASDKTENLNNSIKIIRNKFYNQNVDIIEFQQDINFSEIPFADKISAAAEAEKILKEKFDTLIWLDSDTIFISEPYEFLIPNDFSLGFKAVHLTNIGSKCDEQIDEFWHRIYEICKVNVQNIFQIKSMIDRNNIRFYINAGLVITRTKNNIFSNWYFYFKKAIKDKIILSFIKTDRKKLIFLHQAVLSATILTNLNTYELFELSFTYNYPLHLHQKCPKYLQPNKLEDCITVRYDDLSLLNEKNFPIIINNGEIKDMLFKAD